MLKLSKAVFVWTAVLVAFLAACSADAQERIISFHSDIQVRSDASLVVTETITVQVENQRINRGIYRDFPTRYKDRAGNDYVVGFEVESVLRDGRSERYAVERLRNGMRVRIGNPELRLQRGEHVFEIRYRTTRQLGFFDDHDELYWNVTGTDWEFRIDRATAVVRLPSSIPRGEVVLEGYSGAQGSTERNFQASVPDVDGDPFFETTEPLAPREGLTVVVSWPKGFVEPPGRLEKISRFAADNSVVVRAFVGTFFVLCYFLIAWWLVGRDPDGGTVIPRFEPPAGFSPAACRFISRMGYDSKCFAAALINLAVKGVIGIKEYSKGSYSLIKQDVEDVGVSPGEHVVYERLLAYDRSLTLAAINGTTIHKAVTEFTESLKDEYEEYYFRTNRGWFVGLVFLMIGSLLWAVAGGFSGGPKPFLLFVPVYAVVATTCVLAASRWFKVSGSGWKHLLTFIPIVLLAGACCVVANLPVLLAVAFGAQGAFAALFLYLVKRPTLPGKKLMDEIEGFRMYLKTAETRRLAALHPPEETPELFEKFLPYALALDVEQEWAERFSTIVSGASRAGADGYAPAWYHSTHSSFLNTSDFTSGFTSSLPSAVASASTPPGSVSGSGGGGFSGGGGGGFSGGGGGGGGGGGW